MISAGTKEVDNAEGFWSYRDVDCDQREDLVDDADYQDGFRWDCCEQWAAVGGDVAEGCIVSKHVPKKAAVAKKVR